MKRKAERKTRRDFLTPSNFLAICVENLISLLLKSQFNGDEIANFSFSKRKN